jgi:nucleotide-binding universal stress UspA family protein
VLGSVAHTLAHESTIPTLVLHEHETASLLAHPDAARPLRALVPLDGSPLAEAALAPAAHLVASLTTQGELHLTQVVKPLQNPAGEASRARVTTYLTQVMERWQAMAKELGISLSWSVALETDVASALLSQENKGRQPQAAGAAT